MTTWNDPSQAMPARTILTRLRALFAAQEKTHEQVLRNGDGIRNLQVLLDLFRHPDSSTKDLAQKLEATLDALQRSATQMSDGIKRSDALLTSLQSEAERRDEEIADLQDLVRSLISGQDAAQAKTDRLSYYLGLDPAPIADEA